MESKTQALIPPNEVPIRISLSHDYQGGFNLLSGKIKKCQGFSVILEPRGREIGVGDYTAKFTCDSCGQEYEVRFEQRSIIALEKKDFNTQASIIIHYDHQKKMSKIRQALLMVGALSILIHFICVSATFPPYMLILGGLLAALVISTVIRKPHIPERAIFNVGKNGIASQPGAEHIISRVYYFNKLGNDKNVNSQITELSELYGFSYENQKSKYGYSNYADFTEGI